MINDGDMLIVGPFCFFVNQCLSFLLILNIVIKKTNLYDQFFNNFKCKDTTKILMKRINKQMDFFSIDLNW